MLNQIILVGRLVQNPKIKELENGQRLCTITLAIPRTYKNMNGEYETDFIDCIIWNNTADSTKEYCCKGDLLGIKGRIQTRQVKNIKYTEIIAEKVTFLATRKEEDKGE